MDDVPPPLPSPASASTVAAGGEKKVRALGWLLLIIGVFLSGAAAFVALTLGNAIARDHTPGAVSRASSHWHGTAEFTHLVFGLLGALFLFGLNALLTGIYQAGTGRRNPMLAGVMLLLLIPLVYFGYRIIQTGPAFH